jgi:2-amino-4-hydroxy-6-hydroxymethyldihydropteridine diphosphokinase
MAYYALALGANVHHPRHRSLRQTLLAALAALDQSPISVLAAAPMVRSRPVGPSRRTYVNAAALISTDLAPPELLRHMQRIEFAFGRRRRGQPGRARTLDLDIILWSGGIWATSDLQIPHPAFRTRCFVMQPLAAICPLWRDPVTHLTIRQLNARLDRTTRHP